MSPTPKDDARIVEEWIQYWDRLRERGAPLQRAALALSKKYHCSPTTVRRYLDPSYGERERIRTRESNRLRYARQRRRRAYERNYRRLTRHPERYLEQIFESRTEADLEVLTSEIRKLAEGAPFTCRTINRILREYETGQREGRIRGPPYLAEVRPQVWSYSDVAPKGST